MSILTVTLTYTHMESFDHIPPISPPAAHPFQVPWCSHFFTQPVTFRVQAKSCGLLSRGLTGTLDDVLRKGTDGCLPVL